MVFTGLFAVDAIDARSVHAAKGDCGQPASLGDGPAASDALFVLKSAIDVLECALCICDVDDSGSVLTSDALRTLKGAVGQPVVFGCPLCVVTTTTSTTSTTLDSCCPAANGLDNVQFNEVFTCQEQAGGPIYCGEVGVEKNLLFQLKVGGGGGEYEVRHQPDDGVLKTGILDGTTFTWTALAPGEYTESGVWKFSCDLQSFSGPSSYEALDQSYSGSCNITGAADPATPPDPPLPPACQVCSKGLF